jgi:integrase
MAKHRGHNEGTYFKLPNGKWRAQVSLNGKRLSKTCTTATEAKAWIRETTGQIDKGLTIVGAKATVNELLDSWLAATKSSVRAKTYEARLQISRDHIRPYIGKYRVADLGPSKLQALYKRIETEVGSRSAQMVHSILHAMFEYGLKLGVLPINPARATVKPRCKTREMSTLDAAQVSQLLTYLQGHPRGPLFFIAITTGMRQGELFGLKWADIDWLKKTIHIQRQAQKLPNRDWEFLEPKTKYAMRTIVIGDNAIAELRKQLDRVTVMRRSKSWIENDLVFPNTVGLPLCKSTIDREFKKILSDAGLPNIRFHDLRHTAASLMLNNGVPLLVASRMLGHAAPSITLNVYGHLMPHAFQEVADLMDVIVSPIQVEV